MEKKKEFIINVLYIAIICALVYFGINFLLGLLFPFLLGFFFAYISVKINRKTFKDDSKLHRGITLAVIYVLIGLLISVLVALGVNKIIDFFKSLPTFYKNTFEPYLFTLENSLDSFAQNLPINISSYLNEITDGVFEGLRSVLSSAAGGIVNITTSLLTNVPTFFVSLMLTIITSFYIVFDYAGIAEWIKNSVSSKTLEVLYEIKDFIENTLFKIVSAYAVIMGITFIELCIGLSIFGVSNSPMWSFFIALLDILPVLGVGTVLIPWGISSMIMGKFVFGLELLILYVIITVIRQVIEPHMVGTNLGIHPLATLISMIIGAKLFSAVGMFGFPLTLSFLKHRSKNKQES